MRPLRCLVLLACATLAPIRGRAAAQERTVLTVFAAASLTDAFRELGRLYEARHRGQAVQFNFAGSQQLASQLEQGAVADVFATADERWMGHVQERKLLAGTPRVFARNQLVVIVPRSNPGRIDRLQDIARQGVKLVVAADAVPVGRYTRDMLRQLERAPGFPPDFARRVLGNVVSQEDNVKGIVAKVQLGEADAGIAYRSDLSPASARLVRALAIPERWNVVASYPIAALAKAPRPDAAVSFIGLVQSTEGQGMLTRFGFLPADTAAGPSAR
jgi:molybdate transport system substrate-binding protein